MLSSRTKPQSFVKIASQKFSSSDDFKGLVISPSANSLAYCTNGKIVLYTSESLSVTEGHAASPPSEWNLVETDCFLQNLCLTKRYLVATTIGKNSVRFYPFN